MRLAGVAATGPTPPAAPPPTLLETPDALEMLLGPATVLTLLALIVLSTGLLGTVKECVFAKLNTEPPRFFFCVDDMRNKAC